MSSIKLALGSLGQYARQCQNCHKPETPESKLSTCTGCLKCHCCSRECQVAHWPQHKSVCKQNRAVKKRMKEDATRAKSSGAEDGLALDIMNMLSGLGNPKSLDHVLKPWMQIHRPMLQWAFIQALSLYSTPSNLDTHLLQIVVEPTFTPPKPPRNADSGKLFRITSIMVLTHDELFAVKPDLEAQFNAFKAQSQVIKQKGGMGLGVILLLCLPIVHFMPVGIEDRTLNGQQEFPDWQEILKEQVHRGVRF